MIYSTRLGFVFIVFVALVRPQVPVTILSIPSGAKVTANFEKIGVTPINNHLFTSGRYLFEVELDGYAKIVKSIDLYSAKHLEMEFRLNELFPVVFKSKISGLKFETGGQTWENRKAKLRMEAGRHSVKIYAGYMLVDSVSLVVNGPLNYVYDPR